MARRNQAAAQAVQTTPTQETAPQAVETVQPTPDTLTSPQLPDITSPQRPEIVQAQSAESRQLGAEEPKASRLPDVRESKSVNLGPDKDSPRLRLLRSSRFNQMQIGSDEELPQAQRDKLNAAGWTERAEEGIWTKQLPPRAREGEEPKSAWPTVLEAERLFHDIANAIRADRKMPPVDQERGAWAER
jgi:hypothetical protein